MSKVRVESFSISLDGFGAGPNQDIDHPMGIGADELHQWFIPTKTFLTMHSEMLGGGSKDGETSIDDDFAARGFKNIGAWIMGRNMFGPVRGSWNDSDWKGWWGENPPYHVPVYVLTHYERQSIEMEGGTTFHFVTEGIHEALDRALEAAEGKDIRIGGGPDTIRQYLRAGLIDELHIAISPVILGSGERLLEDMNLKKSGYDCVEFVASEKATHVVLQRQ